MQESTSSQAIRTVAAGARISGTGPTVAVDGIVGLISEGGVIDAKLRVVEDVERLQTEFHRGVLAHLEVLEKSHIGVESERVAQYVSAGVAEGEATGRAERTGIQQKRAEAGRIVASLRNGAVLVSTQVRIRSCSTSVRNACIIWRCNPIGAPDVKNSEGSAGLKGGNPR